MFLCFSCKDNAVSEVDSLNDFAYDYHYKNLDSTTYYACKAYQLAVEQTMTMDVRKHLKPISAKSAMSSRYV